MHARLSPTGGAGRRRDARAPHRSGSGAAARAGVAVNPLDAKIRSGEVRTIYPAWLPDILGYDVAGVIEAIGAAVGDLAVGDEAFGTLDPLERSGYAAYAAVSARALARKPSNLSFAQASTIGSAVATAHGALLGQAHLQAGQTVLVHGGSGAVGGMAIQLARRANALVIATASTANLDAIHVLGADVVVDYTRDRFEDVASQVDVVLDTVGGQTHERSYAVLRKGGLLVTLVPPPPDVPATQARGFGQS